MKKHLVTLLKIAIPVAIIAWLLTTIEPDEWARLRDQPKDWGLLSLAFLVAFMAVCVTFVRWYLLVRTLEIPFRLADAFRLGFLGYLLNFVSVGAVGGDLFKAFFIAHEQPGRRAEAVATVVVDRMIGLYALLLVTSAAIFFIDIPNPTRALAVICNMTYLATGVGGIFVLMVLIPGFTRGSISEFLTGLPKVGHTLGRLITSVRMYRKKYGTMLIIFVISMSTHAAFGLAIFLIARAMLADPPTLGEHIIIVPLSNVAGALPLTPAGLGTFEGAVETLYRYVPSISQDKGNGLAVAIAFRLMTIAIAGVGVIYYWISRREVREVMDEAEHARTESETPV